MKIVKILLFFIFTLTSFTAFAQKKKTGNKTNNNQNAISQFTSSLVKHEGFLNFYVDDKTGKIFLEVDKLNSEFLYVNSLPAGVGSNDIGLDRGQLGGERIVYFWKSGPKLLLIQPNYKYRAITDNDAERRSVEEAFAKSVLWGFKIEREDEGHFYVDATDFLLRDAHDVSGTLKNTGQGDFQLDVSRSAIYPQSCKNFPENTELEAILTFTGKAKGNFLRSVAPSSDAVTVRQHHSFIKLPDQNYKPRIQDPRSGFFGISYQDYATPISENITKRYIARHRLEKKNPEAAKSEAIEPIIYYLDPGAPEPVKSALLDGARWWNRAFEEAGFIDAFQVKVLPKDVDPLDVRYNVIQWVHRSTRGWSYGSSVIDPRTGEIIKGHVSLGSLRVRQDYLIAQGLLSPFENGIPVSQEMEKMALARLRQLSAHEVGHTLGLMHNFAASVNDRGSVMDYPHPFIQINPNGQLDFSQSYKADIGTWDVQVIKYGYSQFRTSDNEIEKLQDIILDGNQKGLKYISDKDARPQGGAHLSGHLWDNGNNPYVELDRIIRVREIAMKNFGLNSIPAGTEMSELERVLVPLYLSHRYQVEAAVKIIGGLDYGYTVKGDGQSGPTLPTGIKERDATRAILKTLSPEFLTLDENVLNHIPPSPPGINKGREYFDSFSGLTFDPLAAAGAAADHTLSLMFHPERLYRLAVNNSRNQENLSPHDYVKLIFTYVDQKHGEQGLKSEVNMMVEKMLYNKVLGILLSKQAESRVKSVLLLEIENAEPSINRKLMGSTDPKMKSHYLYIKQLLEKFRENPSEMEPYKAPEIPAGSPIGCGSAGHF